MNSLFHSLLLALLMICPGMLHSQDAFRELDKVYGLDPAFFNGKKYSFFMPAGTEGTQYLFSETFLKGSVALEGIGEGQTRGQEEYLLNYDVYNQKLLLKYSDETGAEQIIEVTMDFLNRFNLGNINFEYLGFKGELKIYQVLGDGKYEVLYYWRKSLKLSNSAAHATYAFSEPAKDRYLLIDGQRVPFSSNGSFINKFDPDSRDKIRNYIQEKGINVKKSSDGEMTMLINFINNLK